MIGTLDGVRAIAGLTWESLREMFRPPFRGAEIIEQISVVGVGSLVPVLISTAFSGLILTNEIAWHMNESLHTVSMIPGFSAQFIIREMGVAIPTSLVISKVGASIAAELGTMRMTDQIDALKLLGVRPVQYLVVPRLVGCVVGLFCLTLIAIFVTLSCSVVLAVTKFNFNVFEFLAAIQKFVTLTDIASAGTKALVFGAMIPLVAATYGLRAEPSAEGVGLATTQSVVANTLGMISLDFVLTYLFSLIL